MDDIFLLQVGKWRGGRRPASIYPVCGMLSLYYCVGRNAVNPSATTKGKDYQRLFGPPVQPPTRRCLDEAVEVSFSREAGRVKSGFEG